MSRTENNIISNCFCLTRHRLAILSWHFVVPLPIAAPAWRARALRATRSVFLGANRHLWARSSPKRWSCWCNTKRHRGGISSWKIRHLPSSSAASQHYVSSAPKWTNRPKLKPRHLYTSNSTFLRPVIKATCIEIILVFFPGSNFLLCFFCSFECLLLDIHLAWHTFG
jgi:hypothetical protein